MRLHTLKELDSSEGTVRLHSEGDDKHLILHPTPNPNDPNDPLRWSRSKKNVCFASVCAFTFLTNYAIGGLSPAFYLLSIEFNKTQAETSDLLIWPILVLGVFNFLWVPVSNYVGKRPVFVFCSLLLSVCYLWGALAQSFESLLWSNIIAAFAGSSTEALGAAIVNDLFFLHGRFACSLKSDRLAVGADIRCRARQHDGHIHERYCGWQYHWSIDLRFRRDQPVLEMVCPA